VKSKAVIQFLKDWREFQHGMIHRNGRVKVEYDPERLPHCFTIWRGAEFLARDRLELPLLNRAGCG
jgi:Family of unknown function (DUF6209)